MSPAIVFESNPRPQDIDRLGQGIDAFDLPTVGPSDRVDLTYFVRGDRGTILAGMHGNTVDGWLYISSLWVDEALRGTGLGSALMRRAEDEGRRRGCTHAYLDTFSYQAPAFYARLGYVVFAELEDFPAPHRRIFLSQAPGR